MAMHAELGLQQILIQEDTDGLGLGAAELAIVMEELGRALVPTPFLASAVVVPALLQALPRHPVTSGLLKSIAANGIIATPTLADQPRPPAELEVVAAPGSPDWVVDGTSHAVLSADVADVIVVVAKVTGTTEEVAVLAVERNDPRVGVEVLRGLDLTRRQADVLYAGAPGRLLARGQDAVDAIEHALQVAAIALAAEQTGAARRAFEITLQYAKERAQFGRAIGSFQAIKHRLADLALDLELMISAVRQATLVYDSGDANVAVVASVAKAFCSEAFFRIAAEMIQLHGGIGFTWEHSSHLYFRRAKSSEFIFGDPETHRALMLAAVGV